MQWAVMPLGLVPWGFLSLPVWPTISLQLGAWSSRLQPQELVSRSAWAVSEETIACCTLPQGMDSLNRVKKLPNSKAWGIIELDVVWLGWATVARGSVLSRWTSSCSSMPDLCSTDTGAVSCGTSGTGGSSTSGALPRVAEGVPLVFFFFWAGSAEWASASFFFFFFLPFFGFFSGGGSEAVDPGSLPWSFLCLTAFYFFSPQGSGGLVFLALFFLVVLSVMDLSAPFSESFSFWVTGLLPPPPLELLVPAVIPVAVLPASRLRGSIKLARPPSSNSSSMDIFLSGYLIAQSCEILYFLMYACLNS